ncbi:MAG: hypothetical protein A2Y98_00830 [Candidatus Portnoybacteria bacterium RBG_19FT_COMBO_36_7]|uniref:Type 4 fimbrial biogenesis protein PilX N-terminal domain-containing protein n=1 Tax=Candidatus Portnoybacteria bacterium RBG_19FT_COMBO_36_7 TaxID=1801992 RepID=A0A1G2F7F3_9BACT|nr:MAG: hypothetical protein A2Y98_00830 [Candidatus Portnoybacteria bacterium RBG_19FT_COMBO_36_7]
MINSNLKKADLKPNRGFAALLATLIILSVVIVIIAALSLTTLFSQKIEKNYIDSTQAYFSAEGGIEDSLYRIIKGKNYIATNLLNVGSSTATINISGTNRQKTVLVSGENENHFRSLEAKLIITTTDISFYYGIQVGDLGLKMDGNAVVHGNIFSNGPITGASNTKIYGDAISAGDSGSIGSMKIKDDEGGGNAWAKNLEDCTIDGDAHYSTIAGCSVGGSIYTPEDPVSPEDMPIKDETINDWKNDAAAGGTIPGYFLGGNSQDSLGPIKVDGDMILDSNAILTITGTIWVIGNLSLNSNVIVQLDSNYGPDSGVIIVDGEIIVDSNITLCGSGGYKKVGECNPSVGSYLMLLSTKNAPDPNSPAIAASSNTETAILYANAGFIKLTSNANLKEATGYGIYMDSNAEVNYEIGLANASFSSGPGASWVVNSWQEVP